MQANWRPHTSIMVSDWSTTRHVAATGGFPQQGPTVLCGLYVALGMVCLRRGGAWDFTTADVNSGRITLSLVYTLLGGQLPGWPDFSSFDVASANRTAASLLPVALELTSDCYSAPTPAAVHAYVSAVTTARAASKTAQSSSALSLPDHHGSSGVHESTSAASANALVDSEDEDAAMVAGLASGAFDSQFQSESAATSATHRAMLQSSYFPLTMPPGNAAVSAVSFDSVPAALRALATGSVFAAPALTSSSELSEPPLAAVDLSYAANCSAPKFTASDVPANWNDALQAPLSSALFV